MSERTSGKVKWFDHRKGFGFIDIGDEKEVFVHYREIQGEGFRTLYENQKVEFDLIERDRGLAAENVVAEPHENDRQDDRNGSDDA
ncbi:MAG: cold shock domain-containing protein [Arenicellales bacterium]